MANDDDEIVALERRFWQTMIDRDAATADKMVTEKFIITGAQGASAIDRSAFSQMMAHGQWTLHDFAFSDVKVVRPQPDLAVIGYKVTEHLTVDGKKLELQAADASTWVRQDGQWRCVLHTESVLGDPFGRDRASHSA